MENASGTLVFFDSFNKLLNYTTWTRPRLIRAILSEAYFEVTAQYGSQDKVQMTIPEAKPSSDHLNKLCFSDLLAKYKQTECGLFENIVTGIWWGVQEDSGLCMKDFTTCLPVLCDFCPTMKARKIGVEGTHGLRDEIISQALDLKNLNKRRPYVLDKPDRTKSANRAQQYKSENPTPVTNGVTTKQPAMTLDALVQSKKWAHQNNAVHRGAQATPLEEPQPPSPKANPVDLCENGQSNRPDEKGSGVEQVSFSAAPPKPQRSTSGQSGWVPPQPALLSPSSPTGLPNGGWAAASSGLHDQPDENEASNQIPSWDDTSRSCNPGDPHSSSYSKNKSINWNQPIKTVVPAQFKTQPKIPKPIRRPFDEPTLFLPGELENLLPFFEGYTSSSRRSYITMKPKMVIKGMPTECTTMYEAHVFAAAVIWLVYASEGKNLDQLVDNERFRIGYEVVQDGVSVTGKYWEGSFDW